MSKGARSRFFVALAIALGAGLGLGGCSSFSSYVSDRWPTWAGGLPPDVPPRPGAPGYEEFISHQEAKDNAAAATAAAAPNANPRTTPAIATVAAPPPAAPAVDTRNAPSSPPAMQRVNDPSVVQGGLY